MNLTTKERVKVLLAIDAGSTTQDDRIDAEIASVSAAVETHLGRHVQSGSKRTEVYHLPRGWRLLSLRGSPIVSVSTVRVSTTRDFSASELLNANEQYIVEPERGMLRFVTDFEPLSIGLSRHPIAPSYVQVAYDGGMATDVDEFIASFPDLAHAVDLQVAYLHKRSDMPAGDDETGKAGRLPGGSYDWLPAVWRAIEAHKRREW